MRMIMAFVKEERGATAVEYGLIVALIAVAIVGSFGNFSNAFLNTYTLLADEITVSE